MSTYCMYMLITLPQITRAQIIRWILLNMPVNPERYKVQTGELGRLKLAVCQCCSKFTERPYLKGMSQIMIKSDNRHDPLNTTHVLRSVYLSVHTNVHHHRHKHTQTHPYTNTYTRTVITYPYIQKYIEVIFMQHKVNTVKRISYWHCCM